MLYREIIAVCSQIHTKHINTLCGQNVELLNVKLAVHILTTGLKLLPARSSHKPITHCITSPLAAYEGAPATGRSDNPLNTAVGAVAAAHRRPVC
jgi:hypothetical protein